MPKVSRLQQSVSSRSFSFMSPVIVSCLSVIVQLLPDAEANVLVEAAKHDLRPQLSLCLSQWVNNGTFIRASGLFLSLCGTDPCL